MPLESETDSSEPVEYPFAREMTERQKRDCVCEGVSWQEMVDAYENAPFRAKVIVDHLKKNINPTWRASFFIGPQGVGKTTTAIAIPHFANWHIHPISAAELMASYRNRTKEALAREFELALSKKRKVVIVIDEINELFEYFDSESHDASATSKYFWGFLDKEKRNSNLFIIGTMNRENKLPDPLKQRMGQGIVKFEGEQTRRELRNRLKKVVARSPHIELDDACNDVCLNRCIAVLKKRPIPVTTRDFENVLGDANLLAYQDDSEGDVRKIKPSHFDGALEYIVKYYDDAEFGAKKDLTDAEWRDFTYVQNKIIEARYQCAQKIPMGVNASGNMGDFVAAAASMSPMAFMKAFNVGANASRPPGLDLDEVNEILEQELTEDQKSLYRSVMGLRDDESLLERGRIDRIKRVVRGGGSAQSRGGAQSDDNTFDDDSSSDEETVTLQY